MIYILKKNLLFILKKLTNKQIFGFSAITFDNNCEAKTKITININLEY